MPALRSHLDIPVIGTGIASYYVALMLGSKFSIITESKAWSISPYKFLGRLGIVDKLASVRYLEMEPNVEDPMGDDARAQWIMEELEKLAWKAIEEDGAHVIVLGSGSMSGTYEYLRKRLPVPVINPPEVGYKVTRMLVELGLTQSRTQYPKSKFDKSETFRKAAAASNVLPELNNGNLEALGK